MARTVAGDRPVDVDHVDRISELADQGDGLYSDLLFGLTHQRFDPAEAERLWRMVLLHKGELTGKLGRNPGVLVAAVDYVTNIEPIVERPTLISERQVAEITQAAVTDELTGLYDRTALASRLEEQDALYQRHRTPYALLLLDIDDFKAVNDTLGHAAGDEVLVRLSGILRDEVRKTDVVARYGGEEFLILAPHIDLARARTEAERIRKRVITIFDEGPTVSIGVAVCPEHGVTHERVIDQADAALYEAKRAGKNRVCEPPRTGR